MDRSDEQSSGGYREGLWHAMTGLTRLNRGNCSGDWEGYKRGFRKVKPDAVEDTDDNQKGEDTNG